MAQNCSLGWSAPHGSPFTVAGYGYVKVSLLTTSLPSSVSWNSVENMAGKRIGGADFTSWPNDPSDGTVHYVGMFNCSSEVALRVGMNDTAQGSVDLAQDSKTGWFVQYDC